MAGGVEGGAGEVGNETQQPLRKGRGCGRACGMVTATGPAYMALTYDHGSSQCNPGLSHHVASKSW